MFIDAAIGGCIALVVIVLACSIVWAMMRFGKGGAPMTDEERAVPTAEGGLPPSVLGGGAAGYTQPYGKMG